MIQHIYSGVTALCLADASCSQVMRTSGSKEVILGDVCAGWVSHSWVSDTSCSLGYHRATNTVLPSRSAWQVRLHNPSTVTCFEKQKNKTNNKNKIKTQRMAVDSLDWKFWGVSLSVHTVFHALCKFQLCTPTNSFFIRLESWIANFLAL